MTLKTHSGAKKRFWFNGSGLARMKAANLRHNMRKRARAMKRNAHVSRIAFSGDQSSIRQMLPYGL